MPTTRTRRRPPSWRRAATTSSPQRFAQSLTFGTAGLRGPLRGGPNGMNLAVVLRTTWAVAKVLKDRGLHGRDVVVGRDARHGSEEFALAAAEVLAAQGFSVSLLLAAAPTPVVAFAVRHMPAAAGIQITASHNPPSDNGYKVYFDGGFPIVPADRYGHRERHRRSPVRRRDPPAARRGVGCRGDPALHRPRRARASHASGRCGWP